MFKSQRNIKIFKLLVTIFMVTSILYSINLTEATQIVHKAKMHYVAIALILIGLHLIFVALRWHAIISFCGESVPKKEVIRYTFIGHFFRSLLPLSIASDVARIVACKKIGLSKLFATLTVLIDRTLGLASLVLIVFAVNLASSSNIILSAYWTAMLALISAGLYLIKTKYSLLESAILIRHKQYVNLASRFSEIRDNIINQKNIGSRIVSIVSLSIAANLSIILSLYAVALSIDCKISLMQSMIYFPLVLLSSLLPVSVGGWGVREIAFIYVFKLLSLPNTQAVTISLIFGLALATAGLVGGVMFVWDRPDLSDTSKFSRKM